MRRENTISVILSSPQNTKMEYRQNGVFVQETRMVDQSSPLFRARKDVGMSRPKLAELAGTSPQQIEKLEKGLREMTRVWAERLAPHLTVSPEFLVFSGEKMVPLVGFASAGSDEILFEDAQGPFDEIPAPDWATDKTVAVSIRGTSLGPLLNGWLAFYDDRHDPPEGDLFGFLCICGLEDGRVVIKKLRPGTAKGLFHLESAIEGTMYDVPVKWAAKVRSMEAPGNRRREKPVRPVVKPKLKRKV